MQGELATAAFGAALTTNWLGRSYHYLATVTSTNDCLKEMAVRDNHLPAGTVVLADYQSQGRGRLERQWEAPAGTSLLLSIFFRPNWPAEQAQWLTMMASVAAAEAITAATGLPIALKWPNDLMLEYDGQWHKVGGLLLEGGLDHDGRLTSAIVGIGINVNIPAAQLPVANTPATSLLVAGGRPISRLTLLTDFLARLEAMVEAAESGVSPHAAWNQRLMTLGRPVQVSNAGSEPLITGVAEGTTPEGQLLVRDGVGRVHTVSAGDVTLR